MAEETHLTELPVKRPREEEAKENGGVSLQMEESNGVAAPAECISTIIPGWSFEISPMWPVTAAAATIIANINSIPMLNDTNFKTWKENIFIVLGCMDLDLMLRKEQPPPLAAESSPDDKREYERWERSNRMSLMIMKRSIPEAFRGAISDEYNAKKFLEEIEKRFAKNEKVETSTLLATLVSMKYKGKGNIREYIMEISNIASKLKTLKLELSEDLLVHLVLISLPAQYSQFTMGYNTQNDKWTLNELISHCVQEEERVKQEKTESAHLTTISKDKKRKRAKGKEVAVGSYQPKYAEWRVKKGLPVEPKVKGY